MKIDARQLASEIVEFLESDGCPHSWFVALGEVERIIVGHNVNAKLKTKQSSKGIIESHERQIDRLMVKIDELQDEIDDRRRLKFRSP